MAERGTPPPDEAIGPEPTVGPDADFEAPVPEAETEAMEGETEEDQEAEGEEGEEEEPEAPAEEEREIARVLLGDEQFKDLETSVDDLRYQYVNNQKSLVLKALRFVGPKKRKDFEDLEKRYNTELTQLSEQKILREAKEKGIVGEGGEVDVKSEKYIKLYIEKSTALAIEEGVETNKIAAELASKSKIHKTLEWIKKHPSVLIASGVVLSATPAGSLLIIAGLAFEVNNRVIWPVRDRLDIGKTEIELAGMIELEDSGEGTFEITPSPKLADLITRNIKRKESDEYRKRLHKRIVVTMQEEIRKGIDSQPIEETEETGEAVPEAGEVNPDTGETVPNTDEVDPETEAGDTPEQTIDPSDRLRRAMKVFDSVLASLNEADKRTIINRDRLWTAAAAASGIATGFGASAMLEIFV